MHAPLALVSDWGDDHEMREEFGHSLCRTGDQISGFVAGMGLFSMLWVIWMLVRAFHRGHVSMTGAKSVGKPRAHDMNTRPRA